MRRIGWTLKRVAMLAILLYGVAGGLPAEARDDEIDWQAGPTTASLGDQVAEVALDADFIFAGAEDTVRLMEAMGNPTDGGEVGLVAPKSDDENWFIIFEYRPVGYVTDDDKDEIDANAILESIRAGTEEANRFRAERGAAAIHVVGWHEEPRYDENTNNLTWALLARSDDGDEVVNYNVRLLGRGGFMSVTLVDSPQSLAASKPAVQRIIDGFSYVEGKKYAQFVPGDHIAELGLAALVAGGAGAAAVKLGLFAALAKFFAKAYKAIIVGLLALAGMFRNLIRRLFGGEEKITMPEQGGPRVG